jgi:hypothetical protein
MSRPRLVLVILAVMLGVVTSHSRLIVAEVNELHASFSPLFQLPFSLLSGAQPAAATHQANGVSWHAGEVHHASPSG